MTTRRHHRRRARLRPPLERRPAIGSAVAAEAAAEACQRLCQAVSENSMWKIKFFFCGGNITYELRVAKYYLIGFTSFASDAFVCV